MAIKPIAAHCDAGCKKKFTITRFRTKKVKNGIKKTFFLCPHCKHEYVSFYASAETLKLQKDMRKLHRTVHAQESTYSADWIQTMEDELKARIKHSMDEARAIAEG